MRSFTDSDMPDSDNIENTTSINLIDLPCVLLFCTFCFD